jgi:hypothetical protein
MMLGMGATTPTSPTSATTTPSFMTGLETWASPSTALSNISTTFQNASVAFSGPNLPYTAGLLFPALALVGALFAMSNKGGRR